MILGREPSMVAALVAALIALGAAFGLKLSGEQVGAIMAVTYVLLGLIVRQNVTPTAAPSLPTGTAVTTPEGPATVEPVA